MNPKPTLSPPAASSPESLGPACGEGWVRIVTKQLTINGRRDNPTCSGAPGTTSSSYSFFHRQGTADGLLVFFNGGGACWNAVTCTKPRLAGDKAFFSGNDDQEMVGFARPSCCRAMARSAWAACSTAPIRAIP